MASGTTTTWGRPYPVASDAPNVHTDIQALANSLDTVPAYPATMTTSATATAGLSYVVSASQTLTLPASPTKGDIIRAAAASTVTGATAVTVAASGGKGINGLGLSAASLLKLGTPFAHTTLQYDGTNWQIIDGQQDTGWLALSLSGGVSAVGGGYSPSYRVLGDRVWLRGGVSFTATASITIATLPAGARPANGAFLPPLAPGMNSCGIGTGGGMLCAGSSFTNAYLEGQGFSLFT